MKSSEELSSLPATSRVAKLGSFSIAIIIGLVSIGATFIFSINNYQKTASSNAVKLNKIEVIDKTSSQIEQQRTEIKDIISRTQDPKLKEKLIEYQKDIDRLIIESRSTKEILKRDIEKSYKGSSLNIELISAAYADDETVPNIKKSYILWSILVLLALVYLGALYSLFFSRSSKNIELATDLVKTLTGFYIGIATSVVA